MNLRWWTNLSNSNDQCMRGLAPSQFLHYLKNPSCTMRYAHSRFFIRMYSLRSISHHLLLRFINMLFQQSLNLKHLKIAYSLPVGQVEDNRQIFPKPATRTWKMFFKGTQWSFTESIFLQILTSCKNVFFFWIILTLKSFSYVFKRESDWTVVLNSQAA